MKTFLQSTKSKWTNEKIIETFLFFCDSYLNYESKMMRKEIFLTTKKT